MKDTFGTYYGMNTTITEPIHKMDALSKGANFIQLGHAKGGKVYRIYRVGDNLISMSNDDAEIYITKIL